MAAFPSSPSLVICFSSLATIFFMTRRRRKLLALGPRSSRFDVLGGREVHLMLANTIRVLIDPLRAESCLGLRQAQHCIGGTVNAFI